MRRKHGHSHWHSSRWPQITDLRNEGDLEKEQTKRKDGTDDEVSDRDGDDGLGGMESGGVGLAGLELTANMAEVEVLHRRPLHHLRFLWISTAPSPAISLERIQRGEWIENGEREGFDRGTEKKMVKEKKWDQKIHNYSIPLKI